MKRYAPEDLVAIDTETSLIFPSVKAPPLVCVSISTHDGEALASHTDPELVGDLCDLFDTRHVTGANFVYDVGVFLRFEQDRCQADRRLTQSMFRAAHEDRVHCVQMREKLNDLRKGRFLFHEDEEGNVKRVSYSLDAICRRRFDRGKHYASDDWRTNYHDVWGKDESEYPKDARDYAIVDAVITRQLDLDQEDHGNETAQFRAHLALHLASCRGFMTDNDNVCQLRDQCEEWIEKIEPNLKEAGLIRPDGSRNIKATVRRMLAAHRDNPEALTLTTKGEERLIDYYRGDLQEFQVAAYKAGKFVSISSPACMESKDPLLVQYGVYSKLTNMLNGTVKHLEEGTFLPIQTYFDPLKETGRTSSSGPNIQNQRRGIDLPNPFDPDNKEARLKFSPDPRECFRAREGMVLLACDYSGAETHTLAQVCKTLFGFSKMADALNSDEDDLHIWIASILMKRSYADVDRLLLEYKYNKKHGKPTTELQNEAVNMRQFAKVANFGFPGGCGPAKLVEFAKGMGITIDQHTAAMLKQVWMATWPEMKQYFDYISQCEADNGWYFVNHINVDRIRGKASFTAACNSYFQGLAADGAKAALWEVTRRQWVEPKSALYGTYIVNFVHDEIILEVPLRQLESAARELQIVMADEFNKFTPDVPVTTSAEANIHWQKEMQPVFDKHGEFVWDERKAA